MIRKIEWDIEERESQFVSETSIGAVRNLAAVDEPIAPKVARQNAAGSDSAADSVATEDLRGGEVSTTAEESAQALRWYGRFTSTTELVISELEREFLSEAQQTLRILAAVVDFFKDTVTTTPSVEWEFEKLCQPFLREIWPEDFSGAAAKVAADLAALRQRVAETDAAGRQVASLAAQAHRL